MNFKRLIIAGIVASILFLILDMIFGIIAGGIMGQILGQPYAAAAGIETKMGFGLLFELINGFMLAAIYALIYRCLPGEGWSKGISYGLIVWGLRVLMWAFSTFMMTDLSPTMISVTVVTGLLEVLILGVVIAAIYRNGETT